MKIYVADLKAYNEGSLEGKWIDIEGLDADGIDDELREFLDDQEEKHGDLREEYAIHDYDGMPVFGEYPDLEEIAQYVENVETHGEEVAEAAHVLDVDIDDYEGRFESDEDYGYEYAKATGLFTGVSETFERYFDFASYGRDLAMDTAEHNGHYFSAR